MREVTYNRIILGHAIQGIILPRSEKSKKNEKMFRISFHITINVLEQYMEVIHHYEGSITALKR